MNRIIYIKKLLLIFFSLFFILLFFSNCVSAPEIKIKQDVKKIKEIKAKHIVFIGLDGFGAAYLPKADMPALKQIIAEGSSCMEVYNVLPCYSFPNWISLLKGTPHDLQDDNDFPSIFTVIENAKTHNTDYKINIAFFYEWYNFVKIYAPSESSSKAEVFNFKSSHDTVNNISSYIKENKPYFTAIIFDQPDLTGHKKGFGSKAYYKQLTATDNYIAIIKQAVIDADIYNDTVFFISTDHGGSLHGHHLNTYKNRQIPLVISGKGIKKNYTITSLQRIFDIAPTIAYILGLDIPDQWTGSPITEILE